MALTMSSSSARVRPAAINFKPLRTVYVDSRVRDRTAASQALCIHGYAELPAGCCVDVVDSNFAALEKLTAARVAVVFLEADGDGIDGLTAAELIRALHPSMKLVLVSARAAAASQAESSPFDAVLLLPFAAATFKAVVAAMAAGTAAAGRQPQSTAAKRAAVDADTRIGSKKRARGQLSGIPTAQLLQQQHQQQQLTRQLKGGVTAAAALQQQLQQRYIANTAQFLQEQRMWMVMNGFNLISTPFIPQQMQKLSLRPRPTATAATAGGSSSSSIAARSAAAAVVTAARTLSTQQSTTAAKMAVSTAAQQQQQQLQL
jgi:CheY-like chemotaxis protein